MLNETFSVIFKHREDCQGWTWQTRGEKSELFPMNAGNGNKVIHNTFHITL